MESRVADTLDMLALEGIKNDARETDPSRKFLTLDPHTASIISTLLRAARARRVLEIGTSVGYSTVWLAWSVRPFEGKVTSIDRSAEKQSQARRNLTEAGLLDGVNLRYGDATEIVETLSGPFDAVFFDADRVSAPAQLLALLPKLAPGAILFADNAISHEEEIFAYLRMVESLPEFSHRIVPVGKGLSVAYRDSGVVQNEDRAPRGKDRHS